MAKITVDIERIVDGLKKIGYCIANRHEYYNNGAWWQIKFANSEAIVCIYDTNKKNSVISGKCSEAEKEALKEIVDALKFKELLVDDLNPIIVELINQKHEEDYYDYKVQWPEDGKQGDLLHDILCLANNTRNVDAYLIIGVSDGAQDVPGVSDWRKSNEIYDLLRGISFAGDKMPDIEMRQLYYMFRKIDVLVCHKSQNIPFYITQKYRGVNPYHIYTRIGDTNTPKGEQASYTVVEKLWRMHHYSPNSELSGMVDATIQTDD